jgi:hypothetical protein
MANVLTDLEQVERVKYGEKTAANAINAQLQLNRTL